MKRKGNTNEVATKFVRAFEHVDGNWPSHVYLAGRYGKLKDIIKLSLGHYAENSVEHSEHPVTLIEAPHVSLSKPFVLRVHQIVPFLKALSDLIRHIEAFAIQISSKYRTLMNENGTRRFIALHVDDKYGRLLKLVDKVSEALRLFQQPPYYQNPIFHISIASMLVKSTMNQTGQDDEIDEATSTGGNVSDIIVVTLEKAQQQMQLQDTAGSCGNHILTLAESDSSDEDSTTADWQRSVLLSHTTAGTNASSIHCASSSSGASASSAAEVVSKRDGNRGLFDLLGDYGSDDDEETELSHSALPPPSLPSKCDSMRNSNSDLNKCSEGANTSTSTPHHRNDDSCSSSSSSSIVRKKVADADTQVQEVAGVLAPALTKVLSFTSVECKIGNRLYRFDLMRPVLHSSEDLQNNSSFYEVK